MRSSIVLCGGGDDGDMAALWAEERAGEARLSARAARVYADRVRGAYQEVCRSLVGAAGERPVLKISVEPGALTPRFDMVDAARPPKVALSSPRAQRLLRAVAERRKAARRSGEKA